MRCKIIKVKDEGTSLKHYIVLEPGVNSSGDVDVKEIEIMEYYGWSRRYGQYPYIIIDPGSHAKASAVISHFSFPPYDTQNRSEKFECNSTNLIVVKLISQKSFNDLPDFIDEKTMEKERIKLAKNERRYWKEHAEKISQKNKRLLKKKPGGINWKSHHL